MQQGLCSPLLSSALLCFALLCSAQACVSWKVERLFCITHSCSCCFGFRVSGFGEGGAVLGWWLPVLSIRRHPSSPPSLVVQFPDARKVKGGRQGERNTAAVVRWCAEPTATSRRRGEADVAHTHSQVQRTVVSEQHIATAIHTQGRHIVWIRGQT